MNTHGTSGGDGRAPAPFGSVEENTPARPATTAPGRLLWLDTGRTVALMGMVVFHFARDLEIFGALATGTTASGSWAIFARIIAGSFIFLSGVSLVIAHGTVFRPHAWSKRLAMIAAAAVLVSVATYFAFPERFIYFGILHAITLSSLLGAGLLRAPAWALIALALLILAANSFFGAGLFATPWLAWTGLSLVVRPSLDFVPLVPWLAVFLGGMSFAKSLPVGEHDLPFRSKAAAHLITWPGRHSLAIYLGHQPVLLAILWVVVTLSP